MIARGSAAALLALFLLRGTTSAQVRPIEGRWRLLILPEDPGAESVRGELRLVDSAGQLRGTLRLETDSGPPLPLAGRQPSPDSLEFDRAAQGPLAFVGGRRGLAWGGRVLRAGRSHGEWEAAALDEDEEFYPALPAFVLRQVFLGSPEPGVRVSGAWLGAARAALGDDPAATLMARHAGAARQAGAPAVAPDRLAAEGPSWLLGFLSRPAWRAALVGDLATLRSRLLGDRRIAFDALFDPASGWVADLHDAALREVRARRPAAELGDWGPALAASGLAPPGSGPEALMDAAWRLWSLARTDSGAFELRLAAVRAALPDDGGVAELLQSYDAAAAWHRRATAALGGLVDPGGEPALPVPASFGGPGAAASGRVDPRLAAALVRALNWEGERWLERHGADGLGRVIDQLDPDYGAAASVDLGRGRVALTTPQAEARDGRLGAGAEVRYDPGEAPLLAAVRVAMERERVRLLVEWQAGSGHVRAGDLELLPDLEPHLAAGVAEVAADSAAAGLPFVAAANALRLALAEGSSGVSPALGHELVRALAAALRTGSRPALRTAVAALGLDLSAVADRPGLAGAWGRWRGQPPGLLPRGRGAVVVPELHFAVEGGVPLLAGIRLRPLP